MTDNGRIKLSLPKLEVTSRNNPSDLEAYFAYALKFEAYTKKYQLWDIINGKEKEPKVPEGAKPARREILELRAIVNDFPDDIDTAERLTALEKMSKDWARYAVQAREYTLRKNDAQAALTESLSVGLTMHFCFTNKELTDNPAGLWQALKDWFMFNTPTILSALVCDFTNIVIFEKESIDEFSVRMKTCLSHLNMLGHSESISAQKEKFMTAIRMHPKQKYETLALVTQSSIDYDKLSLDELIK